MAFSSSVSSVAWIFTAFLLIQIPDHVTAASSNGLLAQASGNKITISWGSKHKAKSLLLDISSDQTQIHCQNKEKASSVEVALNRTNGINPKGVVKVSGIQVTCIKKGAEVAGFSRNSISLPSQIFSKAKVSNKFAYCLSDTSASITPVFFGGGLYSFMLNHVVSSFLQHTPLVKNPSYPGKYYLSFQGMLYNGSSIYTSPAKSLVQISSTEPYTRLVRPAYLALRDAFRKLTIPRVPSVAPFDTCFNVSKLGSTRVGPPVPQIELKLGGNVTWTVFGFNSLVFFNNQQVGCLAFLDAGPSPATSVIGLHQQYHNLLEFDRAKSRLGFTGLLFFYQTTCGNFNFTLSA